ncbi:MAG: putative Ig domain-containing protein [Acidobacteria bacterium]|nr:putative Ig domain-containing protein [Acidobacteriota bacterium]
MRTIKKLTIGVILLLVFPLLSHILAGSTSEVKETPIRWNVYAGQTITFEFEVPFPEGRFFYLDNYGLDYLHIELNGYEIDSIIDSFDHCKDTEFCCDDEACYMPDEGAGLIDLSTYLVAGLNTMVVTGAGDSGAHAEIGIVTEDLEASRAENGIIPLADTPPSFIVPPTPPPAATLVVDAGSVLTFSVKAATPDTGTTVQLGVVGLPLGATFPLPAPANPVQSTFTWTPTTAQAGLYDVTFRATDNRGLTAPPHHVNIRVRIPPPNRAPVFSVPPTPVHASTLTVEVARNLTFTVRATDPDISDVVSLRVIGLPRGAQFAIPTPANPVQSTFTWTPTLDQARLHTLVLRATDGRGLSAPPHLVKIRVRIPNRWEPYFSLPPTPPRRAPLVVYAGSPMSFAVMARAAAPQDVVTFTATGLPVGATFPIPAPSNPARSTFNWTPGFTQGGSYTVTFAAQDNRGLSTGPYRLRIIVRQPPSLVPVFDVPPTPSRDSTLTVQADQLLTFTVQSTSPSAGLVTLGVNGLPPGAAFTIPTPDATVRSDFSWTPTSLQAGFYQVAFTARDDSGLAARPQRVFIFVVR